MGPVDVSCPQLLLIAQCPSDNDKDVVDVDEEASKVEKEFVQAVTVVMGGVGLVCECVGLDDAADAGADGEAVDERGHHLARALQVPTNIIIIHIDGGEEDEEVDDGDGQDDESCDYPASRLGPIGFGEGSQQIVPLFNTIHTVFLSNRNDAGPLDFNICLLH